ncbi:MAG: cation diffusion facilitator family transporter [Burkholderiaceae bacterium]
MAPTRQHAHEHADHHQHHHDHGQSHGHAGHHHHAHLDPGSGDRRVWLAIWANGLLTVAQIIGGIVSGSLALIADAVHNLSDMGALIIAFVARRVARRPADEAMTFGYGRIELVAALINYTSLILIGLYLVVEGVQRLIDPPEVAGWAVVVLATIALIIDALTAVLTARLQKDSANMRAMFLHNLSDALASVAVVIGGVLILLFDLRVIDPIITIAIAVYIVWLAVREIGGPVRILMLGSPAHIDNDRVVARLRQIDHVVDIHHLHFWHMHEHLTGLDCHVVLSDTGWQCQEGVKIQIKTALSEHFGIRHSTLEFEHEARAHVGMALYGCGDGHGLVAAAREPLIGSKPSASGHL